MIQGMPWSVYDHTAIRSLEILCGVTDRISRWWHHDHQWLRQALQWSTGHSVTHTSNTEYCKILMHEIISAVVCCSLSLSSSTQEQRCVTGGWMGPSATPTDNGILHNAHKLRKSLLCACNVCTCECVGREGRPAQSKIMCATSTLIFLQSEGQQSTGLFC